MNESSGTIIEVVNNRTPRSVLYISNEELCFPWESVKNIPKGEKGFVIEHSKDPYFDWTVKVMFPRINALGWIDKNHIRPVTNH